MDFNLSSDLANILLYLIVLFLAGVLIYRRQAKKTSVGAKTAGETQLNWIVLVIDDDLTFIKLVRSHFEKKGIRVLGAETGERGFELAKRTKPDLIILDVILPGMKGRAVCGKLKEDSETEHIPVMFVTFKNSLDDISAEMNLGAVMHLTKPVDYEQLAAEVLKILGSK